MYNTTDDYKSKIYDTVHFLKVYINDVEIESKYILDCRPSSTLFTNGEIELGSTPSQTIELKLYKSVVPATINKVEIKSGITGEIVPIGVYNVDKAPTSDDYTVTLSLADNMIKFEFNYDGSKLVNDNNGKAKIIQVLQDMCSKAGVELGSTSFLNMNKVISVYDNTVSARTYLSYIAEQAGGFACIGRDGKLYIKSFKYALGKKIGEGKSIVIEKTNNLKAKTVVKGSHSQKTTEGRNLFNSKISTKTTFGVTVTQEGKHRIKLNGQGSGGWAVRFDTIHKFEKGKSYTVTIRKISGSCTQVSSSSKWGFLFYPESSKNTHATFMPSDTVVNLTFKAEESNTAPYIWIGWNAGSSVIGTNSVFNNLILEISIVEGTTAKEYEDFTGSKPSPSVDYSQEVKTVGSNINILPDVDGWEQGSIDNKTGEPFSSTTRLRSKNFIGVEPKTNYFASIQNNNYTFVNIALYDKKGVFIKDYYSINNAIKGANALLIAIPENCYNMKAILRNADDTSNITVDEFSQIKAKFEKRDIQTPYSAYNQGSVEVIKRNRNQFDIAEQTRVDNGITSNYKDGKISLVGTATMNWALLTQSKTPFYLKAGEYTVSVYDFNVEENYSLEFTLYHADNTSTKMYLDKYNKHRTYTVEKDVTGLTVGLSKFKAGDTLDLEFSVQLEEGKTSTNWILPRSEEFIVPIQREMLKGDYIDTVEHHKWQKLILNGTENVIRITVNNDKYIFGIDTELQAISTESGENKEIYCNVATQNTRDFLYSNITADWISYGSDNNYYRDIVLSCMNTYNMTVEEFKAWLKERYDSGNPVIIYYQLKTPIELELTNEQKKVISEIQNMDLYEDYTIIESEAEMQVNFARAEIPFKYFQNFEWGAKYKLSKIRYEDGIRVFEKGDDTGNTLYINPDNMFIVDKDQIDNIYDELKDLELYSFKGDSIVDPALDIGDIVVIDGKPALYCGSSQYSGRWKASISSEIKSKERQETTTVKKPSQKTINRRVQSSIDQANAKITQLIEAKDETSETLTKHEQTMEGFTNTVSKIEKEVESVKTTANSSVKKVEVKYALGNSSTEAPTTGWNTTAPTWTEGKYMWQKTVTTFVDGTVSESNATCIQGAKGADGIDGKDGKDGVNGEKGDTGASGKDGKTYYTWVKYADSPTTGMSDDPAGKTYIGFAYNKTTSVESTNYSDYSWSLIKGEKGDTGDKGEAGKSGTDGNGIKKIDYYYTTTTTQTTPTASNITSTSIPKLSETNKYLWRKEVITFTTTTTPQTMVTLLAIYGDKGIAGDKGADGKTTYFHIKYSSVANPTASQMTETPSAYIGTYVDYTAEDSTDPAKYTWSRFQGNQGEKGEKGIPGIDGTNGKTSYLHIAYANSADGKTDFDVSNSTNKTYIGQYTDFVETDSTDPTKYSWTKIKGEVGQQGKTGATGKGIKSVQDQYYLSTSNTKQTDGAWKNTQDEWQEGYYIWTRSFITWTDNTTSYTTPVLADGINKANQTASDTAKNLENNYNTKSEVKSLIEQSANSITQRIDDIEDITQTAKGTKTLEIESAVEGQLLELRIYGNNNVFKYQYLSDELYLSDNLILGKDKSIIIVTDEAGNKAYYDLKIEDALRQNGNIQDEYILDIENNSAKIIRRINKDGSVKDDEEVELLEKVEIHLSKGKNILEIKDFSATMYAKWVVQNNYTNLFATKVEMNSSITETAEEINLEVRKKVGNNEVISKINQSSEAIQILANKLGLTANDILDIIAGNSINLSSKNITINSNNFNVDKDGKMTCNNATVKGKIISSEIEGSTIKLGGDADHPEFIADTDDGYRTEIFPLGLINEYDMNGTYVAVQKGAIGLGLFTDSSMEQTASIEYNEIRIPIVSQTSLKEYKKNFEKIQYKAIDVIKDIDIYEYNLKHEKDTDKKHIGFVIGNGFNYSKKVTSSDNKGVDSYSFISLCCKAIQELSSKVEELEKKVKEMEGDK